MGGAIVAVEQGQVAHPSGNMPGIKGVVNARLSFETAEQGALKIRFPFRVKILVLRSQVVKTLSGTDAGTVTPSNSVGNMANGTISHAASAALGNEIVATPTTNQIIAKDTDLILTSAKTTVVGKVHVTVQYVRMA